MLRPRALVSLLAVAFLATGLLWGQNPGKTTRAKGLPKYWARLGLSEEQKARAMATRANFGSKIEALESQIAQLRKQEEAELARILSPEQKAALRRIATSKVVGGDDPVKEDKKPGPKSPKKEP